MKISLSIIVIVASVFCYFATDWMNLPAGYCGNHIFECLALRFANFVLGAITAVVGLAILGWVLWVADKEG